MVRETTTVYYSDLTGDKLDSEVVVTLSAMHVYETYEEAAKRDIELYSGVNSCNMLGGHYRSNGFHVGENEVPDALVESDFKPVFGTELDLLALYDGSSVRGRESAPTAVWDWWEQNYETLLENAKS